MDRRTALRALLAAPAALTLSPAPSGRRGRRVSLVEGDPGYDPRALLTVIVWFNGKPCTTCRTADEELGYVDMWEGSFDKWRRGAWVRRYGHVRIQYLKEV